MNQEPTTTLNRAKPYQLVLFPLNNGATNVYFVLILSYVAQFGDNILKLGIFASLMVTINAASMPSLSQRDMQAQTPSLTFGSTRST